MKAMGMDSALRGRRSGPRIGITTDLHDGRCRVGRTYGEHVVAAGGTPVLLMPDHALAGVYLDLCDGFILTGGDDPIMGDFGEAMHRKVTPVDPARQRFELKLLRLLDDRPDVPVLGVCLGMQYMALHAGGRLNQFLPDTHQTAGDHWDRREHAITGALGEGHVHSHHRQAMASVGSLDVLATAHDGVIEAVGDDRRAFYMGVQWHPERTEDHRFSAALFHRLVDVAGAEIGSMPTT